MGGRKVLLLMELVALGRGTNPEQMFFPVHLRPHFHFVNRYVLNREASVAWNFTKLEKSVSAVKPKSEIAVIVHVNDRAVVNGRSAAYFNTEQLSKLARYVMHAQQRSSGQRYNIVVAAGDRRFAENLNKFTDLWVRVPPGFRLLYFLFSLFAVPYRRPKGIGNLVGYEVATLSHDKVGSGMFAASVGNESLERQLFSSFAVFGANDTPVVAAIVPYFGHAD